MSVDWWVRLRSHPDLPICHNCLAGLNGQRDGQLQLMTGKWLVTGFEPIFKVSDVARSVAWFERAGFEVSIHDDTYAFARRDRDLTIHLAQAAGDESPVTVCSTSTVMTPTGWPPSGQRRGSNWMARGTKITASGRAPSVIPMGTSSASVVPFAEMPSGYRWPMRV